MKTETKNWIAVILIVSIIFALVFQWWEVFAIGLLASIFEAITDK